MRTVVVVGLLATLLVCYLAGSGTGSDVEAAASTSASNLNAPAAAAAASQAAQEVPKQPTVSDGDDDDDDDDDATVYAEDGDDHAFHEESCGPALRQSEKRSVFQHMKVVTTKDCGKSLLLDGVIQSAGLDEHYYHEALVHPALIMHPNPKKVMIGGGGELATAREVLRHKSVEKLIMVDIDQTLVEFCLQELPEWNDGAFEDPRSTVIYGDAVKFIKEYDGKFDVIYFDISDPMGAVPEVRECYSPLLYQAIYSKLNPGGIFVTQSGPCHPTRDPYSFAGVYYNIKAAFPSAYPYCLEVETFGGSWGFNMGVRPKEDGSFSTTPRLLNEQVIDQLVSERIMNLTTKPLHFYDGQSHQSLFNFAKPKRNDLKALGSILYKGALKMVAEAGAAAPTKFKDDL